MVITSSTRNRVVGDEPARGFESHALRHAPERIALRCFFLLSYGHHLLSILCRLRGQQALHRGAGGVQRVGAQVGVDVRRGGIVGVAQEELDLLHGDTTGHQEAGTGVPLRYNSDKPEKSRIFKGFKGFKPDF